MRARKPAARRDGVQCWHGGPRNAGARVRRRVQRGRCLAAQRAGSGSSRHTHVAAAWRQTPRGARATRIRVGEPLDLADGKWLLNPGAVGAPAPPRAAAGGTRSTRQAADGAFWLLLDLDAAHRDLAARALRPGAGARARARALGLDDERI